MKLLDQNQLSRWVVLLVDNISFGSIIRNMSNYEIKTVHLAEIFKGLSNPHRLMLFQRMMTCCAPGTRCCPPEAVRICVGDLGEGLTIAPSTLSHHLKELHRAGLIQMQRNGKRVECWIEPQVLERLSAFFNPNPKGDHHE